MECIYRESRDREECEQCRSSLAFSDEGFLTCVNDKCGIIYKDIVDHGAEWRFYGADDNQGNDPTRCGMPINPLLRESSFGCKVLCQGGSNYEMRKIRRYTEWQSMPYKEKSKYFWKEQVHHSLNFSHVTLKRIFSKNNLKKNQFTQIFMSK